MVGGINIFQGIIALAQGERVVAVADKFVLVDLTSWGWTLIVSGVLMLAVSFGMFLALTWARIGGIVIVAVHAATQVAWLGAYPIWSLLMIALDTIVIFALTARWSEANEDLRFFDREPGAAEGLPGDALYGQLPHQTPTYQRRVT
ncbi:MAG TPA: hypothetical protein VI011_03130 [Asanoa sp.]